MDGRTVLEKAQDMKKKINLEEPKGITQNSFSLLSAQEFSNVARDTSISLGRDRESEMQLVQNLLDKSGIRKEDFDKVCPDCKVANDKIRNEVVDTVSACGKDDPCTPTTCNIRL
jgi:peptide subunit release factor 1 (eRF1)